MEKDLNIALELQSISPLLAGIPKRNVFTVPNGYFESISISLMAGLQHDNTETKELSEPGVPAGYFDQLSDQILAKIKAAEGFEIADTTTGTFIDTLDKRPVQFVPAGYFEELPQQLLNQVKEPAKVVSINWRKRIISIAAAAVFTGALGVGLYQYNKSGNNVVTPQIANITLDPAIEKGKAMNATEFKQGLEQLSEEAISQYLEQNTSTSDLAALTESTDESAVSCNALNQLDEKILEKYMDQIITNN